MTGQTSNHNDGTRASGNEGELPQPAVEPSARNGNPFDYRSQDSGTEPAHFKGPWTVQTDPHDPNAHDVWAGTVKVAHLPWKRQADAALIASAPNLLAALKSAPDPASVSDSNWRAADYIAWYHGARKVAIALAEGKL